MARSCFFHPILDCEILYKKGGGLVWFTHASTMIESYGKHIRESNVIVVGNHNTVDGDDVTVVGNHNKVDGKRANVYGDDNDLRNAEEVGTVDGLRNKIRPRRRSSRSRSPGPRSSSPRRRGSSSSASGRAPPHYPALRMVPTSFTPHLYTTPALAQQLWQAYLSGSSDLPERKTPTPVPTTTTTTNSSVPQTPLPKGTTCTICFERPIDVLFMPCKHMTTCTPCAIEINNRKEDGKRAKCPQCRSVIETTTHGVYLAGADFSASAVKPEQPPSPVKPKKTRKSKK